MTIRRAKNEDLTGLNKLLQQVLMVHHYGRPDLFKANVKKYTDEELQEIIVDDKTPIFVGVDEIWFEDLVRPSYDGHSMMGKGIVAKAEIYPSASAKTT